MGIDTKFGTVTTETGSIGENEPVFVLRATDSLAQATLAAYYAEIGARELRGEITDEQGHILREEVDKARDAFAQFSLQNPGEMRIPGTRKPMSLDDPPVENEEE